MSSRGKLSSAVVPSYLHNTEPRPLHKMTLCSRTNPRDLT
jgi:hypothetical protein